jgi:hypothetical protein
MKVSTATLITGVLLLVAGIWVFTKYTATDKWFSLSGNMIIAGFFVILVSAISKVGK